MSQIDTLIVVEGDQLVTVSETGVQGPPGPQGLVGPTGPVGPQGPSGGGGTGGGGTVTYTQSTPATSWLIAHNMGKFPSVTVLDTAGSVIESIPSYPDNNHVQLSFNTPISGTVYLN